MVETKRPASNKSLSTTCSTTKHGPRPQIIVQKVTLDTQVPALPKTEELLPPPDAREYEKALQRINCTLRKLKRQLVVLGFHGIERLRGGGTGRVHPGGVDCTAGICQGQARGTPQAT